MSEVRKTRRRFTPEYRVEAACLVVESGRPIAHVAQELGLVEQTLCRWVHSYRQTVENEPDGELTVDERAELRRLRREIEELARITSFWEKRPHNFCVEATTGERFELMAQELR